MLARLSNLVPEGRLSRLLVAAAGVGVSVGLAVAVLDYIVVELLLHPLFHLPLWAQMMAPLVGLLGAVALLRWAGDGASPSTSEEYINEFHARTPSMSGVALRGRLLAGMSTMGLGGALGLEGPSIYMGSAIGLRVQQQFERVLGRDSAKLLLTAGAAAGVSALFQTPATGLIFALESPYRDDVAHRALLPSLIASATSYLTFASMPFIESGTEWGFAFVQPGVRPGELTGAIAIGVGAGLGGRGFAWATVRAKEATKRWSPWLLATVGGVVLGILVLVSDRLFGEPLTLGPGYEIVDWLVETPSFGLVVLLFFVRAAATLTTVAAGGVGGLFIPLAVQGVLLGTVVGEGLEYVGWGADSEDAIWNVLGLAAFLAAGYRTPIAAVMFVAESSAGAAVVPALIAAAVSQLVAGKASVSVGQRVERLGHLEERVTLPLASALTTDVMTVPPDATVSEFIWVHAIGRRQRVVPVVDGSTYLGFCSLESASAVGREEWEEHTIGSIVVDEVPVARPSWSLRDALAAMDRSGQDVIAVVDETGSFAGVVYESEIVKLSEILEVTENRDG